MKMVNAGILSIPKYQYNLLLYSVAKISNQYPIGGILIKRTGKNIELCSTDTFRLTLLQFVDESLDENEPDFKLIMQPESFKSRNTQKSTKTKQAIVDLCNIPVVNNKRELIEGTFPEYNQVIPKMNPDAEVALVIECNGAAVNTCGNNFNINAINDVAKTIGSVTETVVGYTKETNDYSSKPVLIECENLTHVMMSCAKR